jgi:uncharacterized protein YbjT (DUF2867 family)
LIRLTSILVKLRKPTPNCASWASKLDWILVRPVVLNDKPARGTVRALSDLSAVHGGTVSRADVAKFVVQQLTDDAWLRRAPLITW